MKNDNIKLIILCLVMLILTTNLAAQHIPIKKLVNANTTQINKPKSKVKTYKITAQKNDNQIFGYVTMEPVDNNSCVNKKIKKKNKK